VLIPLVPASGPGTIIFGLAWQGVKEIVPPGMPATPAKQITGLQGLCRDHG
jgi:hypothetical protein